MVLALLLLLPLLLLWAPLFLGRPHDPKLAANYLSRTNGSGQLVVRIGVTNVGDVTTVRLPYCSLNKTNQWFTLNAGVRAGAHRLLPGQGDVIQLVVPSSAMSAHCWITCYYARDGLRTRIYEWQRDSVLPGSLISRLIPSYFTEMPVQFGASTGWIDE